MLHGTAKILSLRQAASCRPGESVPPRSGSGHAAPRPASRRPPHVAGNLAVRMVAAITTRRMTAPRGWQAA